MRVIHAARALAMLAMAVAAPPSLALQDTPADFGEVIAPFRAGTKVRYGDADQTVAIHRARSKQSAPVVVLLDDIGWRVGANSFEIRFFIRALNDRGIAVVDVWTGGSTLSEDVARLDAALHFLKTTRPRDRLDFNRIAVVGRGSGGHFAGLLATDPSLFPSAAIPPTAMRAAIIIDGDGFDIDRVVEERTARPKLGPYFGNDAGLKQRMSPRPQPASPTSAGFYVINHRNAPAGRVQRVVAFAEAAKAAGAAVVVRTAVTSDGNIGGKPFGWQGNRTSDELLDYLVARLK